MLAAVSYVGRQQGPRFVAFCTTGCSPRGSRRPDGRSVRAAAARMGRAARRADQICGGTGLDG